MKKFYILSFILIFLTSFSRAADKQKIIFDCDLGGDIDDAFALSLILTSPEFDVLGIVLENNNTPERAKVACKMLYETGRENIPVVVGEKTGDTMDPQFYWAEHFDKVKPLTVNATDFIIENIKKFPGQVILFTVGPVTNIGRVLDKDPGILKMTKHVYSMFGSFYRGYDMGPVPSAEWNVVADTPASKKFISCGAGLSFAGLDVTMQVRLDENNIHKLAMRHSPLTDALIGLYTLWGYQSYATPSPVLHDVLAVGMVLWPDLFTLRKAYVKVTDNGYTVIDESRDPNCEIGMTVKSDELIKRLMERLLKQDMERN